MDRKSQHWVPASYLSAWCDPDCPPKFDPFVWVLPKAGGAGRRKAPKNLFEEADFYTRQLSDGQRDLSLESYLGQLEGRFCRIRDTRIANREPLTTEDHVWLCGFIAAMHFRTRAQRDAFQQQWGHALAIAEDLQEAFDRMSPEERENYRPPTPIRQVPSEQSLSIDDVRKVAAEPLQHMLRKIIRDDLPVLARMNLVIFTTSDHTGFVSSDHPCVWFAPEGGRRPPSLRSKTIEVTMPISPDSLALLCWEGLPPYVEVTELAVDNANRLQQLVCDEYLVVRRDASKPTWFE